MDENIEDKQDASVESNVAARSITEEKVTVENARNIYRENNKRVVDPSVDGFVVLKNVDKVYDNRVQAVFNFNLSVARNEFIVLVGPSGCGKSTTLRMIAGLEEITNGYLYIDRILSNYLESKDRDIAMVFQSYALYPNMTVYDNIGFGLKARGASKEYIKEKVFEAAEILDLGPYLDRKPKELSGGQMQRVALGRAIVRNAKLFLMDEPLSNLDAKLRVQMRSEIVKLHKNIGATTIYVTHDQTEAMTMADRIVIMNKGVVQQVGTPMDIYNNPNNVFVASFIGNPPMNVFPASIAGGTLDCGGAKVKLPKGADKKYAEFIASRREFFDDFRIKADLSQERALSDNIARFIGEMKKLDPASRLTRLRSIISDATELAERKGFIRFDENRAQALELDVERNDLKGLKRDLVALDKDLKNSDLAVAGIIKKFDSAGVFGKSKESAEVADVGKKKKTKQEKPSLEEENRKLIEKYVAAYGDDDATTNALIGIRPEDIHFYDDFDGNKSEPFTATAAFVELLGSEFCAYIDMFGKRIIMKCGINRLVKTGDEMKLCFDMDKLRLFDAVSNDRVL